MKQTVLVYGTDRGVQGTALESLTKWILDYTGAYPACVPCGEFSQRPDTRYFFVGTGSNNPLLRKGIEAAPEGREAYTIRVAHDCIYIEGSDDGGVLYGCVDFYSKYLIPHENNHSHADYFNNPLEKEELPEAFFSSAPAVRDRGIWTWGHVIYDYRGFLDHMLHCKMNTLVVWDDFVPANAAALVEYAHRCNIKVIWGFSWLWDLKCAETDMNTIFDQVPVIVEKYEREFAHLGGDGIYFQSFTELREEYIGDVLIADAVTQFVNRTSAEILKKHPDLELQFGLHATSVKDRLPYIQKVNPAVRIVWEDCGAFPFAYIPAQICGFDETMAFASDIATLRGEQERFGAVLKGLTNLHWNSFVHQHGPFCLGVSSSQFRANRVAEKQKMWRYIQAYWLANADKAQQMIRLLRDRTQGNLVLTALVEDGMLEEQLYFPTALMGALLWDCDTELSTVITETALRSDVTFA